MKFTLVWVSKEFPRQNVEINTLEELLALVKEKGNVVIECNSESQDERGEYDGLIYDLRANPPETETEYNLIVYDCWLE